MPISDPIPLAKEMEFSAYVLIKWPFLARQGGGRSLVSGEPHAVGFPEVKWTLIWYRWASTTHHNYKALCLVQHIVNIIQCLFQKLTLLPHFVTSIPKQANLRWDKIHINQIGYLLAVLAKDFQSEKRSMMLHCGGLNPLSIYLQQKATWNGWVLFQLTLWVGVHIYIRLHLCIWHSDPQFSKM